MNLSYEFSKIRSGFAKVREDMNFLSSKISENYNEFLKKHQKLSEQVNEISLELKSHLNSLKHTTSTQTLSEKELFNLKQDIKDLKEEIYKIEKEHNSLLSTIEQIKKTSSKDISKEIKEKLQSSELEIYLLKERMVEKDAEIKQIKDINKHIFTLLDELAKSEIDLLNSSLKSSSKK